MVCRSQPHTQLQNNPEEEEEEEVSAAVYTQLYASLWALYERINGNTDLQNLADFSLSLLVLAVTLADLLWVCRFWRLQLCRLFPWRLVRGLPG